MEDKLVSFIEPSIELINVSKDFNKISSPNPTLKQRFVGLFSKRARIYKEQFTAVNNVSFTLKQGDSLALLGHNGCGKSTILQMIAGVLLPTSGTVITRGIISPLIEVGAGFHPELSGYENIFLNASLLGLTNKQTRGKMADIVEFSGLKEFIHAPVKTYSTGMYLRLGFSVAIYADPKILLADEILSVGDKEFKNKCLNKIKLMQKEGMTLILVTHNPKQAKEFCKYYMQMDKGRVIAQGEY